MSQHPTPHTHRFKHRGKRVCIQDGCRLQGVSGISLGDYIHIGRGTEIQGDGGVTIGNNVIISYDCVLWSVDHNYDGELLPYDFLRCRRPITIADHVWLGRNVMVTGGVTIGEGAVVAMGSVVSRDVPPLALVAGNPARVVKYRDEERYYRNRNQGRWLLAQGEEGCVACRHPEWFHLSDEADS